MLKLESKKLKSKFVYILRWLAVIPVHILSYYIIHLFFYLNFSVFLGYGRVFHDIIIKDYIGFGGHPILGPPLIFMYIFGIIAMSVSAGVFTAPSHKKAVYFFFVVVYLILFVSLIVRTNYSQITIISFIKNFISILGGMGGLFLPIGIFDFTVFGINFKTTNKNIKEWFSIKNFLKQSFIITIAIGFIANTFIKVSSPDSGKATGIIIDYFFRNGILKSPLIFIVTILSLTILIWLYDLIKT